MIMTATQPNPQGATTYSVLWLIAALVFSAGVGLAYGGLDAASIPYNGAIVSGVVIVSAIAQLAVLSFAIWIKRWPFFEYLGLVLPSKRDAIIWLVLLDSFVVLIEIVLYVSGHGDLSPFQLDTYKSAKAVFALPQLLLAIVFFAPIAEEIAFRGFLYAGLIRNPHSATNAIIAITITAFAWMLLHTQYDIVGMCQVFIMGIFLGTVRWKTGSTLLTIALHMSLNTQSMIETAMKIEGFL